MPKAQQEEQIENPGIRLNRYLANSGVCIRREADKLIAKGLVEVNGKVVTQMGYRVQKGEKVTYQGDVLSAESRQYILINKPKECVSTKRGGRGLRTIYDIIEYACTEELSPILPLDTETLGVTLMTNDVDLTRKLTQVKNEKKEIYHAFLDTEVSDADLELLRKGLKLKDGFFKPDDVQIANAENRRELGIEIHSLKENVVARLLEELNYGVERLDRVFFAGLTKKNIPRGKWRFLTAKEVQFLKMQ